MSDPKTPERGDEPSAERVVSIAAWRRRREEEVESRLVGEIWRTRNEVRAALKELIDSIDYSVVHRMIELIREYET